MAEPRRCAESSWYNDCQAVKIKNDKLYTCAMSIGVLAPEFARLTTSTSLNTPHHSMRCHTRARQKHITDHHGQNYFADSSSQAAETVLFGSSTRPPGQSYPSSFGKEGEKVPAAGGKRGLAVARAATVAAELSGVKRQETPRGEHRLSSAAYSFLVRVQCFDRMSRCMLLMY